MKKIIGTTGSYFLLLLFVGTLGHAQISYEKGYIIDSQNKRTNCFIKNIDWLNNPTSFKYKFSENGTRYDGSIDEFSEFGVGGFKFVRYIGPVDSSPTLSDRLSSKRAPQFEQDTLYLRELVNETSSLYEFVDGNLLLYFFKTNSQIEPLIYKRYYDTPNMVGENNSYKQQMAASLQCQTLSTNRILKLKYTRKDLVDYFEDYNKCANGDVNNQSILKPKKKKGYANFLLKPGFTLSSFRIPNRGGITIPYDYEFDFGTIIGYQLGFEIEFVFPFNKNKWASFIEPNYNTFESNTTSNGFLPVDATLKYQTFELPIGLRHYFFLTPKSKVFINGAYVLIFDINSEFTPPRSGFVFTKGTNMFFGLGYDFDNKFRIEGRIDTNRGNMFPLSNNFVTQFNSYSVVMGVKLF